MYLEGYEQKESYKAAYAAEVVDRRICGLDLQRSVSGDKFCRYLEFIMPRYYNGIDLSTKLLQVHYLCEDGSGSVNAPVNVFLSDDTVQLGWIIPTQALVNSGSLLISIEAYGTEDEKDYTWKTIPAAINVKKGLAPGEGIPEPDPNWYEQFLREMERQKKEVIEARGKDKTLKDRLDRMEAQKGGRKEIVDYTPTWGALSPGDLVNVETPELHAVTGTLATYTLEGE